MWRRTKAAIKHAVWGESPVMLNWAARYFPIMRILKQAGCPPGSVLEVGSGSYGLSSFYRHSFVGCDVDFPCTPRRPMLPVRSSGVQLPFKDRSFDAVVASDVLEHVPPDQRAALIGEALRVAGKVAVFGFPCGGGACALDRAFLDYFVQLRLPPPAWLTEHTQHPLPDSALFVQLDHGWDVKASGNECLAFARWLNYRELSPLWSRLFSASLRLFPGLVERMLRLADREPFYRQIFVVRRNLETEVTEST